MILGRFVKLNSGACVYVTKLENENDITFSGINLECPILEERSYQTKNVIHKDVPLSDVKYELKHRQYTNSETRSILLTKVRELENVKTDPINPKERNEKIKTNNEKRKVQRLRSEKKPVRAFAVH